MKSPKGSNGYFDKFSRWIFRIYSYGWIQYFFAPLILTLPPLLLSKYVDNDKFHAYVSIKLPDIAKILDEYYLLSIVLAVLYTICSIYNYYSCTGKVNYAKS